MDRLERLDSLQDSLLSSFRGAQAEMWTALPGVIVNVARVGEEVTVDVQPTVRAQFMNPDMTWYSVDMPVCIHCPVQFPSGGGVTLTFPVEVGDECLLVFASRCIDGWWAQGSKNAQGAIAPAEQAEFRMHDLSDGFALLGFRSKPRALTAYSSSEAQLRTDDGGAVIGLNPTSHEVHVQTTGPVNIGSGGAMSVNITGAANITSSTSATVSAPTVSVVSPSISLADTGQTLLSFVTSALTSLFNSHTHPSGTPNTGVPNQLMGPAHVSTTVKGA